MNPLFYIVIFGSTSAWVYPDPTRIGEATQLTLSICGTTLARSSGSHLSQVKHLPQKSERVIKAGPVHTLALESVESVAKSI